MVTSGVHLVVARNWMQQRARNGEKVTWGSQEILQLPSLTVSDIEELSSAIAHAVTKDITHRHMDLCDSCPYDR